MRKKSNSEMKRLIAYIFGHNKREMPLVIVCLFFAAVASSASGVFLFLIIENVITPAISDGFSSVSSVLNALIAAMVVVYGVGVSASWIYARIMAKVGQRTLNRLRKDMFARMETLPISYFDRNKHGDIMSHYTNDIDAIRQFISQSMVQIINTAFTLFILTIAMLCISVRGIFLRGGNALGHQKDRRKIGGKFRRTAAEYGETRRFYRRDHER